jgi:methionine biosynthesis protein MetW
MDNQAWRSINTIRSIVEQVGSKIDPALMETGAGKFEEFLSQVGTSTPRGREEGGESLGRWQDAIIEREIPAGASVLDLGCGDGELLAGLMADKQVRGQGVELDPDSVVHCVRRGVPVIHSDLDAGLRDFAPDSFDYVVLEETLQTLRYPGRVLDAMLEVGRQGLVSFPNFGYWRVRLDLAMRGRMPVTEWLPHRWYETPNIHHLSMQDFLDWAEEENVRVLRGFVLAEGEVRELREGDNLWAEEVLLFVERIAEEPTETESG